MRVIKTLEPNFLAAQTPSTVAPRATRNPLVIALARSTVCLLAAALCLLPTGCASSRPGNPAVTKSVVRTAALIGTAVAVADAPQAIPYLRLAAPVFCLAAAGTNTQPAWIVDALETNQAALDLKTPEAVLIFNGALGIYEAIYLEYGAGGVAARPQLRAVLEGLCEGILAGLPPPDNAGKSSGLFPLPPHLAAP